MRLPRIRIALVVMVATGCAFWGFGQTTNATLSGIVQDAQGAMIPNAPVMVTQIDTGQSHSTVSGADGHYIITDLPIGNYKVTASSGGFKSLVIPSVTLQVNQ